MQKTGREDLDVFLNPGSVAIIGATDRSGSWGSFIMEALLSRPFRGRIYPVNRRAENLYGIPAVADVRDIQGEIDLVIVITPEESVEDAIKASGRKKARGIILITSGFGEVSPSGSEREKSLSETARSLNMRILGPNVSGVFNLSADFNASGSPIYHLIATPLAAVCQGGYAFYDLLASGFYMGMGVGRFIHTGNECDLTVNDFLDYFGADPDVKGIILYMETVRNGNRFIEIARRVARKKPIILYKAGRTANSARAASSHTGALSGERRIYDGLFKQIGIVNSPTMELLLPLGHAMIERPPMKGRRIGIVTMGGSWGVALTDSLESRGLVVPEFGPILQKRLRGLGMPPRASTRNPVDIGASGLFWDADRMVAVGKEVLLSGEVDGLVLHGVGRAGRTGQSPAIERESLLSVQKKIILGFAALEKEASIPVLVGTRYSPLESQAIYEVNSLGVRTYNRVEDIAHLLSCLHYYWQRPR